MSVVHTLQKGVGRVAGVQEVVLGGEKCRVRLIGGEECRRRFHSALK